MTDRDDATVDEALEAEVVVAPPTDPFGAAREELAAQLVEQARADGVSLVGPGGLLADLTKRVLETGLEVEMSEHLGYDKHAVEGRDGGNSRNGTRAKTVLTEVGPVEIDVPRDRAGTFEPATVRKRQRRLEGVDVMVISLCAKGLTTGEISAHLVEVYGTEVSKETISKITDAILEEMIDSESFPRGESRAKSGLLGGIGRYLLSRASRVSAPDAAFIQRTVHEALQTPGAPSVLRTLRRLP